VTIGRGLWLFGGPQDGNAVDGETPQEIEAGGYVTMPRPVTRPKPNYTPAALEMTFTLQYADLRIGDAGQPQRSAGQAGA